ncbi:NAD-glutamate dehydrogenase [Parerythrobacter lacustris]|uniref:NAD-glutamate dehydrogenase n=1 Tax=Parerythrobacter lacustris TaxID=2969984 RepID=A0ABT1XP59_9SPHN|nr:NAD-glutamate dehydrogenase [Parerythrobacter lacustris]MCR2832425.1 NAD-glutamate dehydrogenase [Parerythrobacter lacustris]
MGANKAASSRQPQRRLAGESAKIDALAKHMQASLLPGDTPFAKGELEDAARYMIDIAARRDEQRSSMGITSASAERRMLRIAIVNDDMPFLVDSIAATIAAQGLAIDRLVHPVISVKRSASGELTEVLAGKPEATGRESMIYIETARADARERRELEAALRATLADVRAAVSDWPAMREAMCADAKRIGEGEGAALLGWLEGGMLTQLGHVTRHRDGSQSDKLGICRKSARQILADASFDRAFAWFDDPKLRHSRVPLIIKANILANVHRRVPLDLFLIPIEEDGKVAAISVHAGVWTSAALAASPIEIPGLRTHLAELMAKFGFDAGGHAGKALVHALTALPHDLVIGFSKHDIERIATTMMSLVDRPRPRLSLVEAPLARHLFAFVWLPRDALSTQLRHQIQDLLEVSTGAALLDWSLTVEGGNLAMLRFVLDLRAGDTRHDEKAIEHKLQAMLRGWTEEVEQELAKTEDAGRAAAIAGRFADAFPSAYRSSYGAEEAARDIRRMRHLMAVDADRNDRSLFKRDARLFRREGDPATRLRLKIYEHEGALPLSDAVPALENFGFAVLEEVPTPLDGGRLGTIHDFTLSPPEGDDAAALLERADAIERAIAAVLNLEAENDPFNRLVLGTGLAADEANWLRAFYRYLRQTGMGFTIYTVVDALSRAPSVTLALIDLFRTLHDPDFAGDRDAQASDANARIRSGLAKVNAINDDRLLRLYHALVKAILRTNAFAPAAEEALAFKIQSDLVPNLPKPVPWREIFVYSRRVEGIHLRAGPVARGGLRWSDRRDDFRTEILGLMKAQRVKNAVIVPTGAKGGFYPKQLPNPAVDRDGWAAEGQASYEVFIRTLLSVTDNIIDGKVVHPEAVVIYDGEDPYFVVAADKGTAKFSDVANGIAQSRDFWLDDAFASGGSYGYDHKAMGITAKGAWVSVQRHFLEMGLDVQNDPVDVVGCGDMSGDVFGNGMLLSKAIRLKAAFDHRHIFLDPDPDPAASWKERQRMFDLPRSSWEDYDPTLISKGGGVYSRTLKRIPISAKVRKLLGIEDKELEPDALISAILRAPVDLIWFGGIGTYLKASHENNVQVGDPANDPLRIDANEVRAKVIGEGANLGVTQAARIEFALHGGRINTDFIDNSAGVDCSDNEVNIKIALAAAMRSDKLSLKKRNALLVEMTDEVAHLVLEDNRLQALALSIAEAGRAPAVAAQLHLIESLEGRGALDRRTEGLAASDVLSRRAAEGIGLTRPELAVLLSSTKLVLQEAIEKTTLPDDASLSGMLIDYFPAPMRKGFRQQIESHQLRREIIATKLANLIVNRMGIIHPFELSEEEGVGLADICAAFVSARELFGMDALWAEIETAKMPEEARLLLFRHAAGALRSHMADLIRAGASVTLPSAIIAALSKGVGQLSTETEELLTAASRQQSDRLVGEFVALGAPERLAARVALLYDLDGTVGLASLAGMAEIDARALTAAFTDLGQRLGLDWAQSTSALMNPSDVWERLLVAGLSRDFQQMRLDFLRRLSRRKGAKTDPLGAVAGWAEEHSAAIDQFRRMIGRAQTQAQVSPAMLAQIASQARNLLGR